MKEHFKFIFIIVISAASVLSAQDRPLLSEAIKNSIDTQGIDVAKKHFTEIYNSKKDFYEIDMKGISELSSYYIKAGNYEAGSAVMEIAQPFMQDYISSKMGGISKEMGDKSKTNQMTENQKQKKNVKNEESKEENEALDYKGEARNDLERLTGLYGDPLETDKNRRFWVMVSCDGYLVIGALWGDVAPWWMKSEGDNIFTYSDSFNNIRMEFTTDKNGKATKMIHNLPSLKTPLERLGPLPEDWDPCYEQPKE